MTPGDLVHTVSPEGWREIHVMHEETISIYRETPELDADGRAIFDYVGQVPRE